MPIPSPSKDESKKEFIARCMETMSDEFKDSKQRYAVCINKWKDKKKDSKASVTFADGDELLF